MIPRREEDEQFARDVRQILSAADVGLRWADNVGPLVTLRYLAADAPFDAAVPSVVRARPFAVQCLAAVNRTDPTQGTETGCRVRWTWSTGRIRVHSIDVETVSDEYDVVLGVWRSD